MPTFADFRPAPPGVPGACRDRLVEVERLEWRLGDPGDPAALIEEFCLRHGGAGGHRRITGAPCGVAVLISAAAGAAMIGAELGAATPAPAVPDIAVVAYVHGPERASVPGGGFTLGPWRRSWTPDDHAKAVVAVQEAIGRGDVYQACVVAHRKAEWSGDPGTAVAALCGVDGAVWGGSLAGEDWLVASGSPECFLRWADGRVSTYPIKGTAPATAEGRTQLEASVKERAEHVMIVDLERNDLARVAVPGTVAVDGLFTVRRWADLWQAESAVSCRVEAGIGLAGLLRATCPPGSVTGTPKLTMLELIGGLEPVGRGPSMGALGFYSHGELRLGLTIRTIAVDPRWVHLWTGGGITWRSMASDEVAEAEAKAAGVVAALASAALA